MYQYNLYINTGSTIAMQWITTEVNLLEMYKSALLSGMNSIVWEKGVLNLSTIIGIVDTSIETPK